MKLLINSSFIFIFQRTPPPVHQHACRTSLIDRAIKDYRSVITLGQLRAMQNLRCSIYELRENDVIRTLFISLDDVVDDYYEILSGRGSYDLVFHFTPGGMIKFEWIKRKPSHREMDCLRNTSLKFFRFIDWMS